MAVQPAGQTTRPKGTSHIDVIAGGKVKLPQFSDADGLGAGKAQDEGVGAWIFGKRFISGCFEGKHYFSIVTRPAGDDRRPLAIVYFLFQLVINGRSCQNRVRRH